MQAPARRGPRLHRVLVRLRRGNGRRTPEMQTPRRTGVPGRSTSMGSARSTDRLATRCHLVDEEQHDRGEDRDGPDQQPVVHAHRVGDIPTDHRADDAEQDRHDPAHRIRAGFQETRQHANYGAADDVPQDAIEHCVAPQQWVDTTPDRSTGAAPARLRQQQPCSPRSWVLAAAAPPVVSPRWPAWWWSAITRATLAVTRLPIGMCRNALGPCALECGPSTPVIMNCAPGNFSPSMPMKGIEPPSPMYIAGLPKNAWLASSIAWLSHGDCAGAFQPLDD